jgi:hypothetical protein
VIDIGRSGGGGEYPAQDGFGWTNGVTKRLLALYPGPSLRRRTHRPSAQLARPEIEQS